MKEINEIIEEIESIMKKLRWEAINQTEN